MLKKLLISLILISFANGKQNRIIGGTAVPIEALPWMAQLILETSSGAELCGGAVIHEEFIITAAHCVENLSKSDFDRLFVVLGSTEIYSIAPKTKRFRVLEIISHPKYNPRKIINDIALVRIERFGSELVPELLKIKRKGSKNIALAAECSVAGWGLTKNYGSTAKVLQAVNVFPMSHNACNAAWRPIKEATQVCALGAKVASELNADSCLGDSGGPLFCKFENELQLTGIVSFGGAKCGDPDKPGVYTRASYFQDWILEKIEQYKTDEIKTTKSTGITTLPLLRADDSDSQNTTLELIVELTPAYGGSAYGICLSYFFLLIFACILL